MKAATQPKPDDRQYEWLAPAGIVVTTLCAGVAFVGKTPFGMDNDRSAQFVEFFLALGAAAVIYWGMQLARQGRGRDYQLLRDRLLVAIGFCCAFAFTNFGKGHFGVFVHTWDTYHYYIGAKYFPELGYDKLYDCAMVADAESGFGQQAARRVITDLRTNDMVRTTDLLAHPERCKDSFSPERWEAYKKDLNYYRSLMNEQRWTDMHRDHGFNGTPVWILLPIVLSNMGAVNEFQMVTLNLLDPLYIILAAVMIWWAFGPRTFAIAMVVLGTNFPNRFYWTGGSLLRYDWLFYLVASICLLKKDRPFLAGMAFAYTTLLRLFPGLAAVGPAMAAAAYYQLHRKLDPRFIRYVAGGVVATVLLVGTSLATLGGVESWKTFRHNTEKHASTPLTNHMGLPTVLSWRPSTTGAVMYERFAIDPWGAWKAERLANLKQLRPLFIALCLGAAALIFFALRNSGAEPWMGAAMGTGFIVFGAELTCYYYCFLMGMALLHEKRREVGLLLATMTAATIFLSGEGAPRFGLFAGMSVALDQYYVTQTVVTLAACAGIWWLFTKRGERASEEPEGPVLLSEAPVRARR